MICGDWTLLFFRVLGESHLNQPYFDIHIRTHFPIGWNPWRRQQNMTWMMSFVQIPNIPWIVLASHLMCWKILVKSLSLSTFKVRTVTKLSKTSAGVKLKLSKIQGLREVIDPLVVYASTGQSMGQSPLTLRNSFDVGILISPATATDNPLVVDVGWGWGLSLG